MGSLNAGYLFITKCTTDIWDLNKSTAQLVEGQNDSFVLEKEKKKQQQQQGFVKFHDLP